jgi:hypothetical protein
MPKPSTPRLMYSKRFLATYGQRLQREEIRLVQGFRALSPAKQHALLTLTSYAVLEARRPKVTPNLTP